MLSFIALISILISATVIYKKRFTSETKIGGLYFVQLYYMVMTPIGALLLFDIGSDIFSRPQVGNFIIPSNILLNVFNFCVMMSVVAIGIHSTSTSVHQSFKKKDKLEKDAYHANELIHGPWSHNLAYVGSILSVLLLGLLELNHPYFGRTINFNVLVFGGVILGILGAVAVLRGTYISMSLIAVFLGSIVMGYSFRHMATNIISYPMAIISLASLVTMFILLTGAAVTFAISNTLSKKVVSRAFPKGHRFHEGIDLKVLTMRIEQNFVARRKR